MRVIIDFETDHAGRPMGRLRTAESVEEPFNDWLDLLRAVEGCVAYVTHYPCINCAKILAASGIAEIRYHSDYSNDPLVAPLLSDAGINILQL